MTPMDLLGKDFRNWKEWLGACFALPGVGVYQLRLWETLGRLVLYLQNTKNSDDYDLIGDVVDGALIHYTANHDWRVKKFGGDLDERRTIGASFES